MVNLQGSAPRHTMVVASMPYWNISHGTTVVLGHRQDVTEVSPWMYGLSSSGQIDTQYPPGQAAAVAAEIAPAARGGQADRAEHREHHRREVVLRRRWAGCCTRRS